MSATGTRREFLQAAGFGALALAVGPRLGRGKDLQPARVNILWITCEDISANLGCYGDSFARTPNLDKLASQGVRYTNAYGITGVCAPNRSCLITGVYPSTLGSHDMRSRTRLPANVKCFSEYLRAGGYYCTNNSKTDYNFPVPKGAWDESSRRAHWRRRKANQPFFAVFNFTITHESRCRGKPKDPKLFDPAKVPIPPFHPDAPEVRGNWASYYENITTMDGQAGRILDQLAEDGLADDTIVFFFSDHGAGMPGCKKWVWQTALHVPFMVRFPAKYARWSPAKTGKTTDRMVSFVDFAPTVLSLAGVEVPRHMQGRAFLGAAAGEPRRYVFAIRDRMAERYDTVRVVRDKQFQYIRNFMPHLSWSQYVSYTEQMPTMKVWRKLAARGKLNAVQARYFRPSKPLEELYDTAKDPHQINNLAGDPKYEAVVERMRRELRSWMERTHDLGLLGEYEMHRRSAGSTPYELAHDPKKHPQRKLMAAADIANAIDAKELPQLLEMLDDADPAVRWWGAVGLTALGKQAAPAAGALRRVLGDDSPLVRVAAADALCNLGTGDEALPVLIKALAHETPFVRLRAMNVLDRIGDRARAALPQMRKAAMKGIHPAGFLNRMVDYVPRKLSAGQ